MKILMRILLWFFCGAMVLAGLVNLFFLSLVFVGRGDWDYELTGGYELVQSNGHSIGIFHKDLESGRSHRVIWHYYVTDFCMNEEYIGVRGIPTLGEFATDEELESNQRRSYLIDVPNREVYGPYESDEEFATICAEVGTGDLGQWRSTEGW